MKHISTYIIPTISVVILTTVLVQPAFLDALRRAPTVTTSRIAPELKGALVPSEGLEYFQSLAAPLQKPIDLHVALTTDSIIDATNKERIQAGLPPLRSNPQLIASATTKTTDMITRQYFEHDSPEGIEVSDLARNAQYEYVIVGENLARGNFVTADDLVYEWMNSPGHRANILSSKYQDIGAYVEKGIYNGKSVWFAVQHFGTDRDACPVIAQTLKKEIDTLDKELVQRRAQIANEKAALSAPDRPEGEEYKERVTAFNALVAEYNTTLVISQEKIKVYNAQVLAFNACLSIYRPVR